MLRRVVISCIVLNGLALGLIAQDRTPLPYQRADLALEDRVRDLVGRMTLEEKFWQLFMIPGDLDTPANDYSHGIFGLQIRGARPRASMRRGSTPFSGTSWRRRLGVPIIPFEEAVHGLAWDGGTMFPAAIGLAQLGIAADDARGGAIAPRRAAVAFARRSRRS